MIYMKRLLILFLLSIVSLTYANHAIAAEMPDSVITEDKSTWTSVSNDSLEGQIAGCNIFNKRNRCKIVITEMGRWELTPHFNIGFGGFFNGPENLEKGDRYGNIELGLETSFDWHPFGYQNEWSVGLGLGYRHYELNKDVHWEKNNHLMSLVAFDEYQTNTSNSLNVMSIQIPMIYTHYFFKSGLGISLGAIVNWNVSAWANRGYEFKGEEYSVDTKDIGQRPFTVDFIFKFLPPLGRCYCPPFYFKISPTSFFKNNHGPEMYQLSCGFCI